MADRPRRSWLYVPGDDERKLSRARSVAADVVILDLEDGVTVARKKHARELTAMALTEWDFGSSLRYVRVNAPAAGDAWKNDVAATVAGPPDGYVIPKVSDAVHVTRVAAEVREAAGRSGTNPDQIRLAPIVTEDPEGVASMASTLAADAAIEDVLWGTEDLAAAIGARRVKDATGAMLDVFRVVQALVLIECARKGRTAIDTPYLRLGDLEGLRAEATRAAWMGFAGKQAIHPDHVPAINAAFTPDAEEVARAREVVAAFEQHGGGGAIRVRDEMADPPHLKLARRVLALAEEER